MKWKTFFLLNKVNKHWTKTKVARNTCQCSPSAIAGPQLQSCVVMVQESSLHTHVQNLNTVFTKGKNIEFINLENQQTIQREHHVRTKSVGIILLRVFERRMWRMTLMRLTPSTTIVAYKLEPGQEKKP